MLLMFSMCCAGDQSLQAATGNDSMDDGGLDEGMEASPTPNRRTRREACTCPYCKDGEGRYAHFWIIIMLMKIVLDLVFEGESPDFYSFSIS